MNRGENWMTKEVKCFAIEQTEQRQLIYTSASLTGTKKEFWILHCYLLE